MTTATETLTAAAAPVIARMREDIGAAVRSAGRSWYVITNKKEDSSAEIKIYEDIGFFGVTAKSFADDLEKIEAQTIHVRLNTYGGEAFDGIAIHNALRAHPATIIVHVDGIAASAGSVIAMSGDEIRMADNAFLMIHEGHGGVYGEADDMRQYAEVLDKLNDALALTYQARAGKTRKYWRDKMAEESWFTAEEAREEGLCDCIDSREKAAVNRFDFKIYNHVQHVPDAVRRAWGKPDQSDNAPEASLRSDPPPAIPNVEILPMADSPTNAVPAQTPAAVIPAPNVPQGSPRQEEMDRLRVITEQGHFDQGRKQGAEEGRKAEMKRLDEILAACPDKAMALDAFRGGQSADAVKLAYEAKSAAENHAAELAAEKDMEIRRLKALVASGGYPLGVDLSLSDDDDQADDGPMDAATAKAQAEREWAQKPAARKGFTSKDRYVNFRTAELTGKFNGVVAGVPAKV